LPLLLVLSFLILVVLFWELHSGSFRARFSNRIAQVCLSFCLPFISDGGGGDVDATHTKANESSMQQAQEQAEAEAEAEELLPQLQGALHGILALLAELHATTVEAVRTRKNKRIA
jgi:hypothetical protein